MIQNHTLSLTRLWHNRKFAESHVCNATTVNSTFGNLRKIARPKEVRPCSILHVIGGGICAYNQ